MHDIARPAPRDPSSRRAAPDRLSRHAATDRFEELLARASGSPFYRARGLPSRVRSYAEWARLPLTTKADLRAGYPFGFLAVPREKIATYHESSGTTGEPTPTYFTEGDWDDIVTRFNRNAVAIGKGDAVLVKTPYSLVTTAHQMHRAARAAGALVVPADNRSSNMPYPKVVRLLKDVPVTVAWCLPTEALLWAEAASLQGLVPRRAFRALRAFLVAGEPLSEARRDRIEAIWGSARVFQDYGSTETGSLAGECAKRRLHLWADRVFAEVFDPTTGRASRTGRGQLVVTPLLREAMPIVRYCIEDQVELTESRCECGSPLPVLRVLGRAGSPVVVQGRELFPGELEETIYRLPREHGVLFWRARHSTERLEIEIRPAAGNEAVACRELRKLVGLRLGVKADVRAVDAIVSRDKLLESPGFQKPRFLFGPGEDWSQGIHY